MGAPRASLPAGAGVDDDEADPLAPQMHAVVAGRVRASPGTTVSEVGAKQALVNVGFQPRRDAGSGKPG